uniref:Transmembrane and immunoglobulin domain containing 3 n=1 Tax=Jaculus jaculus TaxID=51337 RepID=A0A8C5K8H2_JACJA
MRVFILLSLALFSEAMVMDEKVKTGFVLDTASVVCNYDAYYKDHPKYWCQGYFRDYCNIIAFTPNSTNHVVLRDTGSQLIVTVSCLVKEDTGWYWCGIQRDFARDDMDFTQLIVDDNGAGDLEQRTKRCFLPRIVKSAVIPSRMSILIICVLITVLEIIIIFSYLSMRKRSQKIRRGKWPWEI